MSARRDGAAGGKGEQFSGMFEQACTLLASVINIGWKMPWEGHGYLLTLQTQRGFLIVACSVLDEALSYCRVLPASCSSGWQRGVHSC